MRRRGGAAPASRAMKERMRSSVSVVMRPPLRRRLASLPSFTARRPKVDSASPVWRQKSEISCRIASFMADLGRPKGRFGCVSLRYRRPNGSFVAPEPCLKPIKSTLFRQPQNGPLIWWDGFVGRRWYTRLACFGAHARAFTAVLYAWLRACFWDLAHYHLARWAALGNQAGHETPVRRSAQANRLFLHSFPRLVSTARAGCATKLSGRAAIPLALRPSIMQDRQHSAAARRP